jgi:hypothetical protein
MCIYTGTLIDHVLVLIINIVAHKQEKGALGCLHGQVHESWPFIGSALTSSLHLLCSPGTMYAADKSIKPFLYSVDQDSYFYTLS